MIPFFIDDLLRKNGIENKYELIRLTMGRIRQLEKNKRLEDTREKLPTLVLREIAEGRLKAESLKEESQEKETPVPTTENSDYFAV